MSPYVLALLLFTLGLGTTVAFVSSHWLLAWVGLEINTLAILPLMVRNHHPRAVEAAIKYFLIQAGGAAVLLFAGVTNAWLTGQWGIQQATSPLFIGIMTIALALKLGLAPLHSWMPEVFQGLDLNTGLVLATWQKLAPLALLFQIQPANSPLLIFLGLASTLIGGWGGLNQTQLRKILAYSSIAQLGWVVLVVQFSPSLATLAVLVYIIAAAATFIILKLVKSTNINMLAISWAKSPALVAMAPLVFLSLAGLPPLTGFMPKWLIIEELSKQGLAPAATLAVLAALLSLYYYLRLTYAMTLTMFPNNFSGVPPWRLRPQQLTLPLACLVTGTISVLPLSPVAIALVAF
uniref:NADH-ubiquinone oxidoreductase chain 2 n=1 Tax=Trematomus nicolai TaxID=36197 RepID=C0L0F3_9TELE|nr:NADH dehydrogenase subunit 2 [Trematomus nicolai]ACN22298.1 NADH dehydrogenase subunit 2 [Trematomus nicolai]ACN22300.1 NADH dehydrogenase subunit 2 [Trematomus nicolai]ACN22302.1 NADH dehydrogenase subunit 2 [Trematomus nicolai]ACN22303.1 NADH dehydrogenase subunit 2 [Trematomus nicolai]ACN22304.1 NADH dehydrogenase subunit 2 [Trematomus nicolai]